MSIWDKVDAFGNSLIEWAKDGRQQTNPFLEQNYPLADFRTAISIAAAYLIFVVVGSFVMKLPGVQPVKGLEMPKFFYNITQMVLCSWMSIQALVVAYQNGYSLLPCNKFVTDVTGNSLPPMGFVLYIFYCSKVLDFMDTIFIILSQKWKQLSFLHVYHHTSIFLFYWLNLNVGYDGDVYLTIVLNGLIHAIMYTYYFVTIHTGKAVGPNGKPVEIWWKPALTGSQMVQFVLMNCQAGYLISTGCSEYPIKVVKAYLYYILTLLFLFGHFAVKEYMPAQYRAIRKALGLSVPPRPTPAASTDAADADNNISSEGMTTRSGRKKSQ